MRACVCVCVCAVCVCVLECMPACVCVDVHASVTNVHTSLSVCVSMAKVLASNGERERSNYMHILTIMHIITNFICTYYQFCTFDANMRLSREAAALTA